ncbi:MAG: hypothetical protein ABMA64_30850 [Myxococcota bacterium]
MYLTAWAACVVPATTPTESGGEEACESPALAEWTGPSPATPADAAACPPGAYDYYSPGDEAACGSGTRVDCFGVPYSVSFRYDDADTLIGVVYCSDTEDYCDGASYCLTYGDAGGC